MRSPGDELEHLRSQSLFRQLRTLDSPQAVRVEVDGRSLDNFSSNDYLALADHPLIKQAFKTGIDQFGVGSGASRLVCGTLRPHQDLENAVAELKSAQAALTFSSGFATAHGLVCSLMTKGDTIVLDKLAHACLIDAARLSGATIRVFPHNDLNKLGKILRAVNSARPADARVLIITESIFSMDGDAAPLAGIIALKKEFDALLLLDEAHAFGILGPGGAGLARQLGVQNEVDFQMGTFSKALGLSGGYVACTRDFRDLFINRARSFIYSTAPSPALAHATTFAIGLIQSKEGDALRERLRRNVQTLADALGKSPPPAGIFPLIIGDEYAALDAARQLLEKGFLVPAIRFPTVPRGTARLRITLSAAHTSDQIQSLGKCID